MSQLHTVAIIHVIGLVSVLAAFSIWLAISVFWYYVFWKRWSLRYCCFADYLFNIMQIDIIMFFYFIFMAVVSLVTAGLLTYMLYVVGNLILNPDLVIVICLWSNGLFGVLLWLAGSNYQDLKENNPDLMCKVSITETLSFIVGAPKIALRTWDDQRIRGGFYIFLVFVGVSFFFYPLLWI